MNSVTQNNDMYHDYPSSPIRRTPSYPTPSLNRQNSRGFDPFNQQNALYGVDETTSYDDQRYNERMTSSMQPNYSTYNAGMAAWNGSSYGHNNQMGGTLGGTARRSGRGGGRAPLPQSWPVADAGYGFPQGGFSGGLPPIRQDDISDEDLIPTAIVIKNIPFAVRKEQLTQIMSEMGLPLPYAFNYHFDNGVFRGLAFANFTTPEETQAVIQHLNNFNLDGRKLRVEYKKMLPQAERDRIEREKRERRGQLEEQHRPVPSSQLQPQASLSSIGLQARTPSPGAARAAADMNDPKTLEYYSNLVLFKNDPGKGEFFDFSSSLPPDHRKTIHALAHQMGLNHHSEGQGNERFVRITRHTGMEGPMMGGRGLHRSATTDFGQARIDSAQSGPSRNGGQPAYLGMLDNNGYGSSRLEAQLRGAKSHADLRSWTPSPAQSASGFPANARENISRYEYGYNQENPANSRPNLPAPTTMSGSNEDFLANGLGNMNLNSGYGQPHGSPQRIRPIASWDRNPGPIGGHRALSANFEESNRNRTIGPSSRQSRGPPTGQGQGQGFPRGLPRGSHRSRGSDELSSPTGVDLLVD